MVGVAFKSRKWKLFALTYKINKFKKSRDEKVLQDSTFQILDFTIPDKKTNHQEEVWVVGWRSENFQMSTKHQFFFNSSREIREEGWNENASKRVITNDMKLKKESLKFKLIWKRITEKVNIEEIHWE